MLDVFVSLMLAIATIAGVGMIVPQAVRLHRTRNSDGVSTTWVGVSFALNVAWLAYAYAQGLHGIVPVSLGGVALYAVIFRQLVGLRGVGQVLPFATAALSVAIVPASGFALSGWSGAGLATGLAYAGQFVPAAVSALRSVGLAGISRLTWQLALLEAVCWVGYALVARDLPLLIGGSGAGLVSVVILAAVRRDRTEPFAADIPMNDPPRHAVTRPAS